MATYTLYRTLAGRKFAGEAIEANSDADALREARRILRGSHGELWLGDELVVRLTGKKK